VTAAQIIHLPETISVATHAFDNLEHAPFNVNEYSRMKFGDDRVARNFAREMADQFYTQYYDILSNERCVVIPAPSTTVPVAATLLSHHFMNRINALLAHEELPPVEWTLIHRNMTYNNNYADLPKAERKKLLAADSIYINRDFVQGKFLIFIDDCRITGTHEEKISEFLLNEMLMNDHAFVVFAHYVGDDPSIEMRLNHARIRDAYDLIDLAFEPGHSVTTRSLRLLLEHPTEDFEQLLNMAPKGFLDASFHAAIVKGYNTYPAYVSNFNALARRLGYGRPIIVGS
jgi:hypothetical protein